MLNCLFWLHTRTWTIMWWAGRTGTWPWTTSVDRTGLKTTSTAPSSWMHSATSSTSSRLSTAWPTSGSGAGPFVHIDADSTWSTMHTAQPLLSTASSCGRAPRELACPPIRKQTWVTPPSSDRMARLFSSYWTGTATVFSCTCETFPGSCFLLLQVIICGQVWGVGPLRGLHPCQRSGSFAAHARLEKALIVDPCVTVSHF